MKQGKGKWEEGRGKRWIVWFCAIFFYALLFTFSIHASEIQQKFEKANQLYFARNFPEAISLYQQLEQEGIHSGDLFYNLANAYYRQGEIGEAVYYYLKALRYAPRDRDLVANFKYVLSKRPEGFERGVLEKIKDMYFFPKDMFTLREMLSLALFSYWLLFVIGTVYYFKRKQIWGIVLLVFLALNFYLLPIAFQKFYEEHWQKSAVVLVPTSGVYSEPNLESIRLFELKEGSILRVKDQKEGFVKIQSQNGQMGWVRQDQVKVLS